VVVVAGSVVVEVVLVVDVVDVVLVLVVVGASVVLVVVVGALVLVVVVAATVDVVVVLGDAVSLLHAASVMHSTAKEPIEMGRRDVMRRSLACRCAIT
jgi:hypothetical protein